MNKPLRDGGFSLIELLTVVAIISILAAMLFVVGPRAIERARLASLANDFKSVLNACELYRTHEINKSKLPLSYGSRVNVNNLAQYYKPYVEPIGLFRNMDIYDRFSNNHDTDRDGKLSLLEFSPMGMKSGPDAYTFIDDEIYNGSNLSNEVSQQMAEGKRPIIYIPVNMKQARVVEQYYWELAEVNPQAGWYATRWVAPPNPTPKNDVTQLTFPPNRYDDYVLISVGPYNNTGGILTPPPSFINDLSAFPPENWYHILALRAYFLATRDANDNHLLDFDYNSRKQGEGKEASYPIRGLHLLPDGTPGQGPVIFHNTGG